MTAPTNRKIPGLAGFLSAIIPGLGFVYLGLLHLALAVAATIASLIVLLVHLGSRNDTAPLIVLSSLTLGGFYLFQIFYTARKGRELNMQQIPPALTTEAQTSEAQQPQQGSAPPPPSEPVPGPGGAIWLLVVGILLQLYVLDILCISEILHFWPLILVAVGIKLILQHRGSQGDR